MVGVNIITSDTQKLKAAVEKEKLNWRCVGATEAVKTAWNNPATPSFYVLDHQGIIRFKWVGNPGAAAMDAALEKVISEVPKAKKPPP